MGRGAEQTFFQRRHPDGQQTHGKVFNMTHHRATQIQTIIRYDLTPVRMAKIKETGNQGGQGYGRKWYLHVLSWECKLVQPPWRAV